MEDQVDLSCFVPEISVSFQWSYFYYINCVSPVTMLLSIWCFVSNAAVIIALFKNGIKSIRPGLLMLYSLTITDFLWGAIVAPVDSGFRLKHLLNIQVCEVYSEMSKVPLLGISSMLFAGTFLNLAIISVDRYLAVKTFVQYKLWVTRHRALVVCTVAWVVSITFGTLRQVSGLQSHFLNYLASGFAIIASAVIIVFQTMTLRLLRRHDKIVAAMKIEGNQANPANTANSAIERQLAKTTTYVVGMLALCFLPGAIVVVISAITKKPYIHFIYPVVSFAVTLCSCINPVLYYRGNEKVKRGILKLVKCQ